MESNFILFMVIYMVFILVLSLITSNKQNQQYQQSQYQVGTLPPPPTYIASVPTCEQATVEVEQEQYTLSNDNVLRESSESDVIMSPPGVVEEGFSELNQLMTADDDDIEKDINAILSAELEKILQDEDELNYKYSITL